MKSLLYIVRYFWELLGFKLIILITLIFIAILFEGIGVTLLLPLLQESPNDQISKLIIKLFSVVGLDYNIRNTLSLVTALVIARSTFLIFQSIYAAKLTVDLQIYLRKRFIDKIFELNYLSFTQMTSSFLNNTLMRELQCVVGTFSKLAGLSVSVVIISIYFLLAISYKPYLVIVLVIFCFPVFFIAKLLMKKTKEISIILTDTYGGIQKLILQSLLSFKYIKATSSQDQLLSHIYNQNEKVGETQLREAKVNSFSQYGLDPILMIYLSMVLFYFVEVQGESLIDLILVVFLMLRAMKGVLGLQGEIRKVMAMWGSIKAISDLDEQLEKGREVKKGVKLFEEGEIVFDSVCFSFGENEVLKNINLKVPMNKTVAIVGESGSGKSTLVNLLTGILKPSNGAITVNGINYEDLSIESLRKKIGYITQESIIFQDSILNNISLWKGNKENVKSACEKAKILDYIQKECPEGLETRLGENGVNLSGGQKQRINIARELYKDSAILILDEATSALDSRTEMGIQDSIELLRGKKTIFVIAHRLSTIKHADKIIVLNNGEIMESGTYHELLQNEGEFTKMVALQN